MRTLLSLPILLLFIALEPGAENWPNWRGPHYKGSAQAQNLPGEFTKDKNVAWICPMPGESAATPIVWENFVFVSSADNESDELLAIAVDRKTGKPLWKKSVGQNSGDQRRQNKASPSPVTDGQRVIFLCGTGDLACFDFEGNRQWSRQLMEDYENFEDQFGYASSPLLYDGRLYILVLQRNKPSSKTSAPKESFLLAIDPQNGQDLWKKARPSDAKGETLEAYTTPIPHETGGRKEIVIFGANYATGHDPATGKELWRWGGYNPRQVPHWRIVPSPVAGAGHIFVAAPKREPLFALPAGKEGHVPFEDHIWKMEQFTPDVCTPLFYDNRLYVLDGDQHILTCLDPKTGEPIWQGEPGGEVVYRASPTAGDGKVYIINEAGMTVVVQAGGDEYKELYKFNFDEAPIRSSIAIADNQLFIRTAQNLYCMQNKGE